MKHTWIRIFALALCAALLSIPAAAAETDEADGPSRLGPVQVWGSVTLLENGSLLLHNDNDANPNQDIIVHLGGAHCVDAVTGLPMDPATLKDGDVVYAWVGPAMALSLPPQATAVMVVGNLPADYAAPQYYEVAESHITDQRAELTAVGGKQLTVPASAAMTPYLTKNIVTLHNLTPGARILVWTDSRDTVTRVVVFPYAYRGYMAWTAEGAASVHGEALSEAGRVVDDIVYLPIRAVAEAVGYTVSWESGKGAVVSQVGDTRFSVLPGSDTALNQDGAWSLRGPCLYEDGVTYLPAEDLALLLNLFWNY